MSPFACLLLALAALLATAHGYCNTKSIGRHSDYPVEYDPVYFDPPGVTVELGDYCQTGMQIVGEDITVCNKHRYGPPPRIVGPEEGEWWPFDVLSPQGGVVKVIQYCDYY